MEQQRRGVRKRSRTTKTSAGRGSSKTVASEKLVYTESVDGNSCVHPDTNLKRAVQAAMFLCAVLIRWYKIDVPNITCWDEAYFVRMGSNYLTHTFFFDLHPPLGKLLIAASGVIAGYDGTTSYDDETFVYHENTPYVAMRMMSSLIASLIVPMSFETVWLMTRSLGAATVASSIVALDCGVIILSRFILLDTWLMTAISFTVLSVTKFTTYKDRTYSREWWAWLCVTGVALGVVVSIKLVGLFVVAYVGLHTLTDLWKMVGDKTVILRDIVEQFFIRGALLAVVPIIIYLAMFGVHFFLLNKSGGPIDGFFTPAFQATLEGNSLSLPRAAQVTYGRQLTLRNHRDGGGYLHYSYGAQRLQMPKEPMLTTFRNREGSNKFHLKRLTPLSDTEREPLLVKSRDQLVIDHVLGKRVHVDGRDGLITRREKFVDCLIEVPEHTSYFTIKAVDESAGLVINTTTTVFQLVNDAHDCVLKSNPGLIPGWLKEHSEVTCTADVTDANSFWIVEEVTDDRLAQVLVVQDKPSFLQNFMESNVIMLEGNAGLVPSAEEIYKSSHPWTWPFNIRGQHFLISTLRLYLLGNPILWWGNMAALFTFVCFYVIVRLRQERGCEDYSILQEPIDVTVNSCWWLLIGWALHYIPFFILGRLTYVHHYYPAFVFNSMLTGVFVDFILRLVAKYTSKNEKVPVSYHTSCGLVLAVVIYSFFLFLPMTHIIEGPKAGHVNSTISHLQWLKTWEI